MACVLLQAVAGRFFQHCDWPPKDRVIVHHVNVQDVVASAIGIPSFGSSKKKHEESAG